MILVQFLVLVAGRYSHYGGLRQINSVGPGGETILDYSVHDALLAGFGKLDFAVPRDIKAPFRTTFGARFEKRLPVEYSDQELDQLPLGFSASGSRPKPWSTAQAILLAAEVIHEPDAAIDAEDFCGLNSLHAQAKHLRSGGQDNLMTGFVLRNKFSDFECAERGVGHVDTDGFLQTGTELTKIKRNGAAAKNSDGPEVPPHSPTTKPLP